MLTAISSALSGLDTGFSRLNSAAARIGRDGAGGDLLGNITDLKVASQEVKVNLAVIRTADDMIGTLIDVMA